MKVGLRWVLAGVGLCALIAAGIGVAAWRPDEPGAGKSGSAPPPPAYPKLIVDPGWTQGGMFADIHGVLGVNDRGCVTVGGDVIVTRDGSRVTPDGEHVAFAGWAPIRLHTSVGGGGGWYPRDWLEQEARGRWDDSQVDAAKRCLADDPNAGLLQFWLAD